MTDKTTEHSDPVIAYAQQVLEIEANAILEISEHLDESFRRACDLMLACKGRIVVSGIGKSGHIARKISSTLSSTGSPSFFVHPAEASHGDLGMVTSEDVFIAISYSGESAELNLIVPALKRESTKLIAITGNKNSTLSRLADITIECRVSHEACPLGLAPTSTTTAILALGDALAIALLRAKGFTERDFAKSHPGGTLGRKLLTRVNDIMRHGDEFPQVTPDTSIQNTIMEITSKKLGMTAVMSNRKLVGVITDGDLRRIFQIKNSLDNIVAREMMTPHPKTINENALAAEALQIMEEHSVNQLVVTDQLETPIGVLGMHDLLRAKIL
ncbi:MAG: KpsF/GutQ family sugar-phosphate isomerase [Proteobacteria bacterium]|nr:KpsF/GutQ family sugar-phosphate isomerase [Pseudomonadota bacterium]MDA1332288.1 KpsF/GutQ family sugar-phosphate isomerase [Pseudomonadota bacterium]